TRDEPPDWGMWAERLLNVRVDIQHIEDSLNPAHVSFFDGVSDYDMLIFRGLRAGADTLPLDTEPAVFFICESLLITVHAADAVGFDFIGRRPDSLTNGKLPRSAVGLAYRIIDTMVDRFLATRDAISRGCEALQDEMLHTPAHIDNQWLDVMHARRSARRLAALSEDQWETVEIWRRDSRFDWDDVMLVRLRDLTEHITRIRDLANYLERDLESAMQLNFAILAQRQNKTMKIFTVAAVVFMPLTLLTGIWGMNFEDMPELHWKYGYPMALVIIFGCAVVMLWWFKRRKFF
ncbi:MAG TPA: magnesium transporter CorA family protein, partial [Nevskiaceae bacterium]|nr:magnesium transporter CorA family protein [Nevskiaceae bacterium]